MTFIHHFDFDWSRKPRSTQDTSYNFSVFEISSNTLYTNSYKSSIRSKSGTFVGKTDPPDQLILSWTNDLIIVFQYCKWAIHSAVAWLEIPSITTVDIANPHKSKTKTKSKKRAFCCFLLFRAIVLWKLDTQAGHTLLQSEVARRAFRGQAFYILRKVYNGWEYPFKLTDHCKMSKFQGGPLGQ